MLVEERRGAGEDLYKEGDAGEKFYIIVKGKVEIATTDAHGEKLRLALYGDGDFFGETALLNDWRHTTDGADADPERVPDAGPRAVPGLARFIARAARELRGLVRQREEAAAKQNESGEAGIDIASYNDGEEPELQRTFVDYDEIAAPVSAARPSRPSSACIPGSPTSTTTTTISCASSSA